MIFLNSYLDDEVDGLWNNDDAAAADDGDAAINGFVLFVCGGG